MSAEEFVRLTVRGRERALDAVVPTAATPATLVPQFLDELRESDPGADRPLALYTLTGRMLPPDHPVGTAGLRDGQELMLLPTADAPMEPTVHDLVDRIVAAPARGLWSPSTGAWVAAALAGMLLAGAVWFLRDDVAGVWQLPLALFVLAAVLHLVGSRPAAWTAWALACFTGLLDVLTAPALTTPGGRLAWVAALLGVALGIGGLLRGRWRAAATAVATLAALVLTAWVPTVLGVSAPHTAGIVAVACLVLLGLVPRLALFGSGMLALDDAVAAGGEVPARRVDSVIAETYAALTGAVVVLCLAAALCFAVLAGPALTEAWFLALLGCLVVGFLVRGTHLPLALQRLAVWGAVAVAALAVAAGVVGRDEAAQSVVVVLLVLAALTLLLAPHLVRPSAVQAAHARRLTSGLERLAMLAVIPVLVGTFGVYADLLETF